MNPARKWFGKVADTGGNVIRAVTGASADHYVKMQRLDDKYQQLTAKRDRKKLGY